jgi:exodeoxyribonuclease VII small subunit
VWSLPAPCAALAPWPAPPARQTFREGAAPAPARPGGNPIVTSSPADPGGSDRESSAADAAGSDRGSAAPGEPAHGPGEAPRLEEELERLERIVQQLEREDIPLDRALALFEEGIAIARSARAKLEAAEGRVREILREAGESFRLRDFEG